MALGSTVGNVYNTRWQLRRQGIVLAGPRNGPHEPRNPPGQQPAPAAANAALRPAAHEPREDEPRRANLPIAAPGVRADPQLERLRRAVAEGEERVGRLRDIQFLQQRLHELSTQQKNLDDAVEEGTLSVAIADVIPNPHEDLYADRGRFVDAMFRILRTQEPYRGWIDLVMNGLGWEEEGDLKLRLTLAHFYQAIVSTGLTHGRPGRSKETFLQDQLGAFLGHLTNPTSRYCTLDTTPCLMRGEGLICAMGHYPATSSNLFNA